jgi:hypothetical protein
VSYALRGSFSSYFIVPGVTISGPGKNSPVIDLTAEEDSDDLSRALKASLETQSNLKFGPSQRAPDPNWAVVPSNACLSSIYQSRVSTKQLPQVQVGSTISQDDQAMDRAIHESLQGSYNDFAEEASEEKTFEDLVRRDNRYVLSSLHPSAL